MASNEDILMQFTAQEDVSSVVSSMESAVTSSLEAITSAMDALDLGLANLVTSAEAVSLAFDEVESSFDSAESSADSFQTTVDGISSDNVSSVSSETDSLGSSFSSAGDEAGNLSSAIDGISSGSISDVESDVEGLSEALSNASGEATNLGTEVNSQDTSALQTNMLNDLESASSKIAGLGMTAVESASAAEQGWLRFGNAINNTGGNWEAQEDSVKSWVKTFSNNMGRSVADTRTAMTTFMNMGMSVEDTEKTMKAVSNYAAQFGMSQADASKNIQMAFMGAGRAVKKLGLDIADFKDEAGNVDKEKLLQAIMEKTDGAAEKYANTYEARVQRMNNAINSLRTDFGKEIMNTIEPLIPLVQQAFTAFSNLPQPIKSTILSFAGLAGGAAIVAGPLLKLKAYMNMAGVSAGTLTSGVKTLFNGFRTLASGGGIQQAITKLKEFAKAKMLAETGGGATSGLGKAKGAGKGMSTVATETEKVVANAGKTGGLGGAASSAGAGMQSTGVGLKAIGQGAMSMLAPLLEIAVVVAVLIPVITALAAEALLCLKGLQLLLDALDFDSIDLSGTIESIKQIGQALFEMGVAMAAMTFSNIMTSLAMLTSGLTGLVNPVQVAGTLLQQASTELQKLGNVKVDPSVAENLKGISTALGAVASSMGSLTNVVLSMALGNLATLGGLLGNVKTAISTAREEITHAAEEIGKIKDLPDIDEGAVSKLKKVSESLESVSTAMEALRGIRDGYNWDSFVQGIFGGVNIQTALENVKQDIIDAGNALQDFNDIPEIPQGLGDKLKNIGDSLSGISTAMDSLGSLRDDYVWDSVLDFFRGDVITALNGAKSTLTDAANALSSLQSLPDVPDGIYTKVQRIGTSAKNVANVLNGMNNLAFPNILGMVMIPTNIAMSRGVLMNVATQLVTLQSLPEIPDGIYTKVQRIGTSAQGVARVLTIMNNTPFPDVFSLVGLPVKIAAARGVLQQAGTQLASLAALPEIPEGIYTKVQRIGTSARNVGMAVMSINTIPFVGFDIGMRVGMAVNAVKTAANQLNSLSGVAMGGGIGAILANVRNAVVQLRATLAAMAGGFRSSGVAIGAGLRGGIAQGLAGLSGMVVARVSSGMAAGVGPATSGGARIGLSATNSFRNSFKIAQIASMELQNATNALANGSGAFYSKVREIAEQAVKEAKSAAGVASPGYIARMWGAEMGYSAMMIGDKGSQVISSIRNVTQSAVNSFDPNLANQLAFSTDSLGMGRLNGIRQMGQSTMTGNSQNPVSIIIGEGAIQLDARNLTTTESRQIMINALEGLDDIKEIIT